jgi:uncharacterized protein YggE
MSNSPTITVEATGVASALPDIARINLFTFAEDPAPGDALTSCSLLTERVLGALRDAGVSPSDLETTSIDLNVQYKREPDDTEQSYRASSGLVATVRPPREAGRVISAAVEAAGTGVGINGVGFDVDDKAPLVSLARRDAVAEVMTAARELANAAGVALGPLVELSEGRPLHPFAPAGRPFAAAARRLSGGPPPVEIGELSVTVTVSAVFEVTPETAGCSIRPRRRQT